MEADDGILGRAHLKGDSHVRKWFASEERHKTRVGIHQVAAAAGKVGLAQLGEK